jgi:hypothetical protein
VVARGRGEGVSPFDQVGVSIGVMLHEETFEYGQPRSLVCAFCVGVSSHQDGESFFLDQRSFGHHELH